MLAGDNEMTEKTILITGANRGIGLEFVKQYAADGWKVIACCRQPDKADALQQLMAKSSNHIHLLPLDVCCEDSISKLAGALEREPIDILLNNAGIAGPRGLTFGTISQAPWLEVMSTNLIGPFLISHALIENIRKSHKKLIVNMSSQMGSIGENKLHYGHYLYRSSKAALNSVMKCLSIELREMGITILLLHPGWVKTEMGGPNAVLTPSESVFQLREQIERAKIENSGKFLSYDGSGIVW